MIKILYWPLIFNFIILFPKGLFSQTYSIKPFQINYKNKAIKTVFSAAETNRRFFNDSLRGQSYNFLLSNSSSHFSYNYLWLDKTNHLFFLNEHDFPTYFSFSVVRDSLEHKYKYYPYIYNDKDTLNTDYLSENVNLAFKEWKTGIAKNTLSFQDFCEYLLPYRVSVEPLENWRKRYEKEFAWFKDSARVKGWKAAINDIGIYCAVYLENTNERENRKEPLSRLGPLQLLFRKKGPCEDMADLQAYVLRSQGIPATVDIIPYWATSTGSHFLTAVVGLDSGLITLDPGNIDLNSPYKMRREPGKVLRLTFSSQPNTLAAIEKNENIPNGVLKTANYIDVTDQYWPTQDVDVPLYNIDTIHSIVYACVLNGLKWRPIWWGKEKKSDSVTFSKMSKGIACLPMIFVKGNLVPVGDPFALGYNNYRTLTPDTIHKIDINIRQEEKYLIFRPGSKYTLYYWDRQWKQIGIKIPKNIENEVLTFNNVPKNSLLLLRPEYSKGKERPFIINENNDRIWF